MAKDLTISGTTFSYPENREDPGWGEEATAWAEAVTEVLSNTFGTGDILQTSATIGNNQTSPTNVIGMVFDPTVVRGAVCEISVYRVTDEEEKAQTSTIYLTYLTEATTWDIVVAGGSDAGITFSITSIGQVQYTTDEMAGNDYSGVIKFRARSLII